MGAVITGWGKCRPPLSLTNADLSTLVDTDDEWIRERTGISERGICHVETTDMAEVAARHALAAAGLETTDLDLIVMATVTPEISCPSNAVCCKSVSVRSMRVRSISMLRVLGLSMVSPPQHRW